MEEDEHIKDSEKVHMEDTITSSHKEQYQSHKAHGVIVEEGDTPNSTQ